MAKRTSRRLVIDASILKAAGGIEATGGRSRACRDFLEAIRRICHRVRLTAPVVEEWDKHQSRPSLQWRTSMARIGKTDDADCKPDESLRRAIQEQPTDAGTVGQMLKDVHLIEAALISDRIIVSLDDKAGDHFARLSLRIESINEIAWINPTDDAERWLGWLERGAKVAKAMTLGRRHA